MNKLVEYHKNRSALWWLTTLLTYLFIILAFFPSGRSLIRVTISSIFMGNPRNELEVQERVTSISFETLDGEWVSLSPTVSGNYSFVNIWATWCGPCVSEMPSILDLKDEYSDKVDFFLVAKDDKERVLDFLKSKGYMKEGIYIARPGDSGNRLFELQEVYPTTFILNPNGDVVWMHSGMAYYNSSRFKATLEEIISK